MKNFAKLFGVIALAAVIGFSMIACGGGGGGGGGSPVDPTTQIPNSPGGEKPLVEMVQVASGTFTMGSPTSEVDRYDNETQHQVKLTQNFYIGKYEVTQEQYETVMGTNPSNFKTDAASGETQSRRPVEMVSWYDALVFCNKLSIREGLSPAYSINGKTNPTEWGTVPTSSDTIWNAVTIVSSSTGYRLPTEAQWEYAARGGQSANNSYKIYSGSNTVGDVAWYDGNSGIKTHEVGTKAANELGLHDMSGNVREWCWDWRGGDYSSGVQTDPSGASSGSGRALRGGYWGDTARYARSAYRGIYIPYDRYFALGFRLLRP